MKKSQKIYKKRLKLKKSMGLILEEIKTIEGSDDNPKLVGEPQLSYVDLIQEILDTMGIKEGVPEYETSMTRIIAHIERMVDRGEDPSILLDNLKVAHSDDIKTIKSKEDPLSHEEAKDMFEGVKPKASPERTTKTVSNKKSKTAQKPTGAKSAVKTSKTLKDIMSAYAEGEKKYGKKKVNEGVIADDDYEDLEDTIRFRNIEDSGAWDSDDAFYDACDAAGIDPAVADRGEVIGDFFGDYSAKEIVDNYGKEGYKYSEGFGAELKTRAAIDVDTELTEATIAINNKTRQNVRRLNKPDRITDFEAAKEKALKLAQQLSVKHPSSGKSVYGEATIKTAEDRDMMIKAVVKSGLWDVEDVQGWDDVDVEKAYNKLTKGVSVYGENYDPILPEEEWDQLESEDEASVSRWLDESIEQSEDYESLIDRGYSSDEAHEKVSSATWDAAYNYAYNKLVAQRKAERNTRYTQTNEEKAGVNEELTIKQLRKELKNNKNELSNTNAKDISMMSDEDVIKEHKKAFGLDATKYAHFEEFTISNLREGLKSSDDESTNGMDINSMSDEEVIKAHQKVFNLDSRKYDELRKADDNGDKTEVDAEDMNEDFMSRWNTQITKPDQGSRMGRIYPVELPVMNFNEANKNGRIYPRKVPVRFEFEDYKTDQDKIVEIDEGTKRRLSRKERKEILGDKLKKQMHDKWDREEKEARLKELEERKPNRWSQTQFPDAEQTAKDLKMNPNEWPTDAEKEQSNIKWRELMKKSKASRGNDLYPGQSDENPGADAKRGLSGRGIPVDPIDYPTDPKLGGQIKRGMNRNPDSDVPGSLGRRERAFGAEANESIKPKLTIDHYLRGTKASKTKASGDNEEKSFNKSLTEDKLENFTGGIRFDNDSTVWNDEFEVEVDSKLPRTITPEDVDVRRGFDGDVTFVFPFVSTDSPWLSSRDFGGVVDEKNVNINTPTGNNLKAFKKDDSVIIQLNNEMLEMLVDDFKALMQKSYDIRSAGENPNRRHRPVQRSNNSDNTERNLQKRNLKQSRGVASWERTWQN